MGKEKTTETQVVNQTQQATMSPQESAIMDDQVQIQKAATPGIIATNKAGLDLSAAFLGGKELPGYFKDLPYGISEQVTGGIVQDSLRDMNTQLAASGAGSFMESGATQSIGTRAAGEIRQNAQEFNLGQLLNLLNLATGSSAQIQQPINQRYSTLAPSLAGLRSNNVSGVTTNTTLAMNPFRKSFATQGGNFAGGGFFKFGGGGSGGNITTD
jgi:hypothetical protein